MVRKAPSLVRPAFLATATLGEHRAAAARLQLVHDADSDDQTVHEADPWGAIASPGPFLPAEIASFHAILELFDERATSSMDARVEVTAPKLERASAVVTFAPNLVVDHAGTLRYEWTRSSDPKQPPRLAAIGTAGYTLRGNGQLVLIDESTQLESVYSPGPFGVAKIRAGTYTGEVWQAGKRVQTLRVVLDGSKARDQRVELDAYADYTLVAMGQVLKPSILTETCPTGSIQTATWAFTHEPTWTVTTQCRSSGTLAPPKLTVPSGRYAVNQNALTNVDLYPQGFAVVTFAGESIRAHGYGYSVSGTLRRRADARRVQRVEQQARSSAKRRADPARQRDAPPGDADALTAMLSRGEMCPSG